MSQILIWTGSLTNEIHSATCFCFSSFGITGVYRCPSFFMEAEGLNSGLLLRKQAHYRLRHFPSPLPSLLTGKALLWAESIAQQKCSPHIYTQAQNLRCVKSELSIFTSCFSFLRERERAQREADFLRAQQVRNAEVSGALGSSFLLQTWALGFRMEIK